jgi:ferredoxin/protein involved in ribonucleotide reduction
MRNFGGNSMKTLYFTSTGNCLYVAKRIGGELLSIPQLQKENSYDINDDIVGIIVPIYGFDVPRPVRFFLNKVNIKADYVFAIMTYGNASMAALTQMKKLLESRNIQLHYSNEIKMVDNYLPMYEISKQLEMKKDESAELMINNIITDIGRRKKLIIKQNWFQCFVSKMFSTYYSSEKGKKTMNNSVESFTVNDSCNGCGTCRKVCPIGNITGIGKPEYQNNCEFCLACIHLCPKNAIHLKNEKSEKRFINKHIKLSEIINANKKN